MDRSGHRDLLRRLVDAAARPAAGAAAPAGVSPPIGAALTAAASRARADGVSPVLLGEDLRGQAHDLGGAHAALAIACARGGEAALIGMREAVARGVARVDGSITLVPPPPVVLLSGGTTRETAAGRDDGAAEPRPEPEEEPAFAYLLGLAVALDGHPRVSAVAVRMRSQRQVAGALVTPDTLERARAAGLDPIAALGRSEAATVFATLGGLLPPGAAQSDVGRVDDADRGGSGGGSELRAVLIT